MGDPLILLVRGTEFRLHGSFAPLLLAFLFWGYRDGGAAGAAWGGASTVLVALSVLHGELSRRVLLRLRGVALREVWLTPLGGVFRVARAAESGGVRLAISFGSLPGALSLVLLAGALLAWQGAWPPGPLRPFRGLLLSEIVWWNLALAGAQLLPLLPGGLARLLVLTRGGTSAGDALARAAVAARISGLAVVLAGLLLLPPLALGGLLLYAAASLEQRVAALGSARITGRFGQQY